MSDLVDAVLEERQALDRGFSVSVVFSFVAHSTFVLLAVAVPALFPEKPVIHTALGPIIALRPGGGGRPEEAAPVAPAKAPPVTQTEEPPEPEPPKVIKPPVPEPVQRKGLPELENKTKKTKTPSPPPPQVPGRGKPGPDKSTAAKPTASGPGGRGTNPDLPGLSIGPPGPGVPGGTDPFGDWYLTSVQKKIWMIWAQQIKAGFVQPIGVSFTILADGTITEVQVFDRSGTPSLDFAAMRAVQSAAPFSPLPKEHGTRYTIQAIFKPTS